jgi:thiamine-monophosphate kinase
LAGGDDYELAFTARSNQRTAIEALGGRLGLSLTRIGRIEFGTGAIVVDKSGKQLALAETGFDHFR